MPADGIRYQSGLWCPVGTAARERVMALLAAGGLDLTALVEEERAAGCSFGFYLSRRRDADRLRRILGLLRPRGCRVFFRVHRRADWESGWKKGWKPFPLTRRFQVVPLWQRQRRCPTGKLPIYLETTRAFGTGAHETTRFTACFVEALAAGRSVLDVGTGTGILAIVALKCGAKRVLAVDIDPEAVRAARENLRANGLHCAVRRAAIQDLQAGPFGLVVANLVTQDLVAWRDRLVASACPGGALVLSGISISNMARVRRAFTAAGCRRRQERRGRTWGAVVFQAPA